MTAYVTLRAVKEGRLTLDTLLTGLAERGGAGAGQDGLPARHPGHRRQRAQDADGEVGERHGGRARRRRRPARSRTSPTTMNRRARRLGMTQIDLRQSERPAGRRPDHLGARPGHPGARADPRIAGIRSTTGTSRRSSSASAVHAQLQHADRPLSGRRRHEDRLHLRVRLQSRRLGDARRQAADRGGARRAVLGRRAPSRPRSCWSAASTATAGCPGSTPSLGTVESLQPINAAPPNLRDEMCGKHRKRPGRPRTRTTSAAASMSSADSPLRDHSCRACAAARPSGSALLQDAVHGASRSPVFTGADRRARHRAGRRRAEAAGAAKTAGATANGEPSRAAAPAAEAAPRKTAPAADAATAANDRRARRTPAAPAQKRRAEDRRKPAPTQPRRRRPRSAKPKPTAEAGREAKQ